MRRSLDLTVVTAAFLLQLMSVHGYHVFRVQSDYDKQYTLLKTVSTNDLFWEHVLKEPVYVNLANVRFRKIIEEELLKDTIVPREESDSDGPDKKFISPKIFFNNVMMSGRKKIGTVVDMTVTVLKTAFTCSAYKATALLMFMFQAEIMRHEDEKRTRKRAGKANQVVTAILMKMTTMQFMDENLMYVDRFFTMFHHKKGMATESRFHYLSILNKLFETMTNYLNNNCQILKDKQEIIKGEGFGWSLNMILNPLPIPNETFKNMFYNSLNTINEKYRKLGLDTGLSMDMWNDILHSHPKDKSEETVLKIKP